MRFIGRGFSIIFLWILLSGCVQKTTLLHFPSSWKNNKIEFSDYSIIIKEHSNWYIYKTDQNKQSVSLIKPNPKADLSVLSYEDKKVVYIRESKKINSFEKNIELNVFRISTEFSSLTNSEYLESYIEEDIQFLGSLNMLPEGVEIRYVNSSLKLSDFSGFKIIEANKPYNIILGLFAIVEKEDHRFLISGKIFSNEQKIEEEEFLCELLDSIIFKSNI